MPARETRALHAATLTEDTLTNRTPEAHQWAVDEFRTFAATASSFLSRRAGKDTVVFPGFDGGAEWGGAAVDPDTKHSLRQCE